MINNFNNNFSEPDQIAIIGMAGRFPGASKVDQFWQNLRDGLESISFFTEEELVSAGVDPGLRNDPNYVKAKGVLENIELFDGSFFGFSPREAEITDPQHRLFIECVWEALEDAGYDSETYSGQIGLFAGVAVSTYLLFNLYSNQDLMESVDSFQTLIGNDKDFLPTQVSYKLNLKGPSINVQTACSTSLVAVHLACQSLLNGESDITLAGGVSLSIPQKTGYYYQQGGIHSPDGHCRAFDSQAQGTVGGNGLGIVVLKRLEDAIADGDFIHAIIKGSAVNNDGSLKVGYTAPSVDGQREVILEALALAGVEPETVTYVETHGTGTILGDPIEIKALTEAFRASTNKKSFCAIGSVKSNIGHLNTAAGVTGLIKTVLALKHQQIPPSLHFQEPNPQIDFANSPFYVNTKLLEWQTNGTPRRAGVSSFGIGGTNAHVILEEAPAIPASSSSRPWQLLVISAKTSTALETLTVQLSAHLQQNPEINIADVAYTLQVGRQAFNHRRIVLCRDLEDAVKALANLDPQRVFTNYYKPSHCPVIFMFSGQGAQYVNMAKELYESEATFKQHIDNCAVILQPHLGLDIRFLLYPREEDTETASLQLQQTALTQSALFVIEYSLAQLFMEWGIHPEAMIGHSIGEYVAATIAGVFSLEDILTIVAKRGQLMQQLPTGSMLAIRLPEKDVQLLLDVQSLYQNYLQIAVINSPSSCVVSGTNEAVAALEKQLSSQGIECRLLHTSHAFHSMMMEPILEEFLHLVKTVKLNPPRMGFISNITGSWITNEQATNPNYWSQHLRQTVRFSNGISHLIQQFEGVFLEVGPGRTLSTLTKQHLDKNYKQVVLTSLHHVKEQVSDSNLLLQTLGRLWLSGVEIDWSGFYTYEQRHRLPLPTYSFERQRYWIEANQDATLTIKQQQSTDKKPNIADWFYLPRWKESTPFEFFQKDKLAEQKLCWLVFVDTYGVGAEITERLKQQGQDVISIKAADNFAKLSECTYAINPQQKDDYDTLLQALGEQNWTPQGIAHFWSLTSNDTLFNQGLGKQTQLQLRYDFFEDCQNLGFYSLLFLTQALAKQNIIEPVKLMVVTSNIYDVTGSENLCPEKATILGSCKVIPQEYPNITCCCFDVVLGGSETKPSDKLVDYLLTEFAAQVTGNVVAYRGHHRWIQTYEPICLDESIVARTRLKKGGVYLITGGLGGVGLVLAEYLAKTVQAKLILLGRKDLPEKYQWQEWLATHDEQDSISRKIRKLQGILALGAEVLVISADVANEQQMHNAIAIATKKFGGINGVIHAAGNVEDARCAIVETSKAEAQSQFHPKVYGLFVLEKVLQGQELDFCQLTSSLASVLGGLGFISYSAANIFMDAFVHNYNQTNSCPWSSVNWDGWGIEEEQQNTGVIETSSKYSMTPKVGTDLFERLVSIYEVPQVVVSTGDLQARFEQWIKLESLHTKELSNKEDLFSKHQRPNLHTAYVPPKNEIEQNIAIIWQQVLGIEEVGINDNFFELGGDSLLGIQIISLLRKIFQMHLSLRSMLDEPTIAGMSKYIKNTRETTKNLLNFSTNNLYNREEIEL
ncbi:MAG: type I polyketide synthase [Nostoc sp.]